MILVVTADRSLK